MIQFYDENVYKLIRKYTTSSQVAEDIYQNIFISVHKHIHSFEFRSTFSTWLYRIVLNQIFTTLKKEKKHQVDSDLSLIEFPSTPNTEMINEILYYANQLPEKQKAVFFLRYENDLKLSEVAEIMDVDIGTIKGYLSRK